MNIFPYEDRLRGLEEVLLELALPLPEELVHTKDVPWGDGQMSFSSWHEIADELDRRAPGWSHKVKAIVPVGDLVAVTVAITVYGRNGKRTREGTGTGPAGSERGITKAEHDALKRAAVKFGLGRELYRRADDDGEDEEALAHGPATKAQVSALWGLYYNNKTIAGFIKQKFDKAAPDMLTFQEAGEVLRLFAPAAPATPSIPNY